MTDTKEAMFVVHWPTGPVTACRSHANGLRNLATMLGTHVAVVEAPEGAFCINCKNKKDAGNQ